MRRYVKISRLQRALLTLSLFIFCSLGADEGEKGARRLQAHLLVGDALSAAQEAQLLLKDCDSPLLFEWAIRSFAAAGDEMAMMQTWRQFRDRYEERALHPELLEEMAWGILKNGQRAPSLTTQLTSIIGAALTQDIKALPFLIWGLRHTNAQIRSVSIELAAHFGDHSLRQEIGRMFKEESLLEVRLKIIHAIGKLKLREFLPQLLHCIGNDKTGAKEKLAAIEALIEIREKIERKELEILARSLRSGLRQLACEVIAHCELKEFSDLLIPLMHDGQAEVCAAALKSWGILRNPMTETIRHLARSSLDPFVGVTASWVGLLVDAQEGEQAMIKWLRHPRAEVRALAASAVAASGPYGIEIAKKMCTESEDLYVKANLALALANQRENCSQLCEILENCLKSSSDKWMISDKGLFKTLQKSNLNHNPAIANFPEVMNQTVRLEILNLLAILESPRALESIKSFLKERRWGVTGLAAETLLGEGDETAIELVRTLLKDSDKEIRLEAALVLATWAKDLSALPTLLEVYPTADRIMQIKILESLGRIGSKTTLPFLIEQFQDPSLIKRIIAACVLIQTLNH